MKAVVYTKFGPPDVLHLKEVEKPIPKDNEILVKVHAASLNAYDWRHVRAKPFFMRLMGAGLLRPRHKILGADIAGRVEAVGRNVTEFRPGDDVFGEGSYGGFAEFVCVAEKRVVSKPADLTFEEAAAVPMAGLTALQGLRDKGKIQAGQKVLINGASGGVGTFRRTDRQVIRDRGHGRLQYGKDGPGALDRRGPCHRLYAGRCHQEWAAI